MPRITLGGFGLDVRPDRVDFRDFPYRPPLRSLPHDYPGQKRMSQYADMYVADRMVLNQSSYGACTGFGLAAVINYLNWELALRNHREMTEAAKVQGAKEPKWVPPVKVSESMLFLNARLYDEWGGEDYEGSSCRGAMKGWHKHGVCRQQDWRYAGELGPGRPTGDTWKDTASKMVLGSYYRINAKSLVEMQAAIHEIHSVYVAADVHDGWTKLGKKKSLEAAVIQPPQKKDKGGHAFALVGYTSEGFIVQNSWGPDWGYKGFAILPYADWIENAYDAWALALGVPLSGIKSPSGLSRLSLQERSRDPAGWSIFGGAKSQPELPDPKWRWDDDRVSSHVIVSTVDGAPVRNLPDTHTAEESVQEVAKRALAGAKPEHIAIYIHGGLNGKDDGLLRAGFMGPWFTANGIVPIFPVWQTDAKTSILHALIESIGLDDLVKDIVAKGPSAKPDERALDRHIEELARNSPGKAAWGEMKNKAMGLSAKGGALHILFRALAKLSPKSKIHLVGHSAGGIAACHALDAMKSADIVPGTVSLFAPAGSASMATATLGRHLKNGYLKKGTVSIDVLSDEREQADACIKKLGVTVYSKSLLYLVSRAFEDRHKTPIVGLERTLKHDRARIEKDDAFHGDLIRSATDWQDIAARHGVETRVWKEEKVVVTRRANAKDNVTQDNVHGSFDNNVDCVTAAIRRICGRVKVPVTDLDFGGG